jgi:hypothetical protein
MYSIGFYLIVKPHLPLFPIAPYPLPPYKNMCFEATIIQETKMEVYVACEGKPSHHSTAFLIQPSIDSSSRNVEANGMT